MTQYGKIDDLKLSLRIDTSDDDTLLERCLNTAETFIQNAISGDLNAGFLAKDSNIQTMYLNAVYALASSYYTYRLSDTTLSVTSVNFTTSAIIAQLRGLYDSYLEGMDADEKV